jgi:hypothetical protein
VPQPAPQPGAVDRRRGLDLDRHLAHEAEQHPQAEGQRVQLVDQHQPGQAAEQAEIEQQRVQRQRHHDRRHQLDHQHQQQEQYVEPLREAEPGQGIGGQEAGEQRQQCGAEGDDGGVLQPHQEAVGEHGPDVVQRRGCRQEAAAGAGRVLEGGADHPQHRQGEDQHEQGDAEIRQGTADHLVEPRIAWAA